MFLLLDIDGVMETSPAWKTPQFLADDFYQFIKDTTEVLLTWNNWTEGEMKTTKATIHEMVLHTGIQFQFGDPEYLHQKDIMNKMHPLLKYY